MSLKNVKTITIRFQRRAFQQNVPFLITTTGISQMTDCFSCRKAAVSERVLQQRLCSFRNRCDTRHIPSHLADERIRKKKKKKVCLIKARAADVCVKAGGEGYTEVRF